MVNMVVVNIVKAFTDSSTGGNLAGIVQNADNLSDDEMLSIASRLGFSESAFVQKSEKADCKIRFFSPKQEVDLCGHAIIATIHSLDRVIKNIETKAGIISVERKDGLILVTLKEAIFGEIEKDRNLISSLLSISENEILDSPIQVVSVYSE